MSRFSYFRLGGSAKATSPASTTLTWSPNACSATRETTMWSISTRSYVACASWTRTTSYPRAIAVRIVALTHDFIVIALLAALRGERVTAVPYLGGVFVPRDEVARFLGGVGR